MIGRALLVLAQVLFWAALFWLVLLKIIYNIAGRLGHLAPCPYRLAFLVNMPWRRRAIGAVLDRVGVQPGETVLELGPGPGVFTIMAAQRTEPGGRLHAVDIQPQMIAMVDRRVAAQHVPNVHTHVASAYELPFEDDSIDRAFLVSVLSEVPDPVRAFIELQRVLKPDGVLSVTEEFTDPHYPLASTLLYWARAAELTPAGRYGNWWRYTLNLRKQVD